MLLSLFLACWIDFSELPSLDINEVEFSNEYLEATNVRVRIFDSNLRCPDGELASFFAVYPITDTSLPIAVVFHTGALDYGDTVSEDEVFQASNRLTKRWAASRIWETLNLTELELDTGVVDLGTLPTALANAGVAQIYPSNCWGDYWHNGLEHNPNNSIAEGYDRQGFDMAQLMIDLLDNESLAGDLGFNFDQKFDTSSIYWVGMGSGGRAITELLLAGNSVPSGIIFDSTPDDLQPYLSDNETYTFEQTAIERIFLDENLGNFTLDTVTSLPASTVWIYSNGDPQHPQESFSSGANVIENIEGSWITDRNQNGHVFINQNMQLAEQSVQFLLSGSLGE
jgi:hypothetical protein